MFFQWSVSLTMKESEVLPLHAVLSTELLKKGNILLASATYVCCIEQTFKHIIFVRANFFLYAALIKWHPNCNYLQKYIYVEMLVLP